jgi:crossover junction endonuclease MUS81
LGIGDFLWIISSEKRGTLVLDCIIERKIADDLAASIMDGRYKHQKFRLKNSGLPNIFYMFEGRPTTHSVMSETTLETAVRRTQLKERFKLIRTENILGSLEYLSAMHRAIEESVRKS